MPVAIKKIYLYLTIVFALVSLFAVCLNAQETNIKSIYPEIIKNDIYVNCHFTNLINPNMQETLASGMSNSLTFYLQLTDLEGKLIKARTKSVKIRYNVWEKRYIISFAGQVKEFSDYTHFQSFLYDSLKFKLLSIKNHPKGKKFLLVLNFLPEKISARQKKKLAFWISNESESKEGAPAKESNSGFSVNLSRLISAFMDSGSKVKIQKISSGPFTIQSLRNNENTSR